MKGDEKLLFLFLSMVFTHFKPPHLMCMPPHLRTLVIAVSSSKEEFDDARSEESLFPFVKARRPE